MKFKHSGIMCSLLWSTGTVAHDASATELMAQQSAVALDTVMVTAQKREEQLQDVPISITALTSRDLEQRGISNLTDFVRIPTPGLQIQSTVGINSLLMVEIRGVTTPDPAQGTMEMGVAVYLDDVYLGRAQGLGTELADPEQIEILRGPQGTLFGRNAQGGAVRIVSKRATGFFGGTAKMTFGEHGMRRQAMHLNLPEFAGIALKLDAVSSRLDGYTRNPRVDGIDQQRDFGYNDGDGYRASLSWNPAYHLELRYAYEQSKTKNVNDYILLVPPGLDLVGSDYVRPTSLLGAQRDPSVYKRVDESFIGLYTQPYIDDMHAHALHLDYQINDNLQLRSISAYRSLYHQGANQLGGTTMVLLGAVGVPAAAFPARSDTTGLHAPTGTRAYAVSGTLAGVVLNQQQKSQELQLIGATEQLEYVFGLYYFNEKILDTRQTWFSMMYTTPDYSRLISTNPFSLPFPGQGATLTSAEARSYAAFVQATWTPPVADNRLHLTGGMRYTSDSKSFHRIWQGGVAVDLRPDDFDARRWDPAATLSFDISPDANVYLRYAQAYRAGGVSVRSPTFAPFGEEVSKAWELGLKSELFNHRLRTNLALFQNNISARQMTVQLDPTNPTITDTINSPGTTRITGLENEVTYALTDQLRLLFNYTYQDAERPDALAELDPTSIYNVHGLFRHSGMIALDWSRKTPVGEVLGHVNYSKTSRAPGATRVRKTDHAWHVERNVANARLTLRNIPVGPTSLQLSAFINNIFDKAYPISTVVGNSTAHLLAPRTFGMDISLDF